MRLRESLQKASTTPSSENDGEHDVALLADDMPEAVLWATFDFIDVQMPMMEGARHNN